MPELVDLLDPATQAELREVLQQSPSPTSAEMRSEAIAALTFIGRQPPHLRPAILSVLPMGQRYELRAHRLVERDAGDQRTWDLTTRGAEIAAELARHAPAPDAADEQAAAEALASLLADEERELGKLD